jgi:hypothetical protein
LKTKIFLPVILSVGILAAACGDQGASTQNLDMIAAQQVAAQKAAQPNTVTITNNNTTTVVTTATVSTTTTATSTVTATVRE